MFDKIDLRKHVLSGYITFKNYLNITYPETNLSAFFILACYILK